MDGFVDAVSPPPEVPPPPPSCTEPVRPVEKAGEPSPATEAPKPRPAQRKAPSAGDGAGKSLHAAMENAEWARRQDFKVMAILWEARRRGLGPITAKKASAIGDELGIAIRHENVRKVVRTRLTNKVGTTTVEGSQPPTFEYELLDAGKAFFEKEYLQKA